MAKHLDDTLVLKYKIRAGKVDNYVFSVGSKGKTQILPTEKAIELIAKYEPQNRNCKVSNGVISLKSGKGPLRIFIRNTIGPVPLSSEKVISLITDMTVFQKRSRGKTLKSRGEMVINNDRWFIQRVKYDRSFLERQRDILYNIDKAQIIDYKLLTMITPYGTTTVDKLSTGCKTVLNIVYLLEHIGRSHAIVNINECGDNALKEVFKVAAGTNISLFISHDTNAVDDAIDAGYRFKVNGKMIKDGMEFLDQL